MGLALAAEAARRGADVTLVCANVTLARPEGVKTLDVETAAELERAVLDDFPAADVLVMAAAPADFRPAQPEHTKISKSGRRGLVVQLEPTPDIVAAAAATRRSDQILIGFAAEHGPGALERGREKLEGKRLDAVVVNDISRADIGFDSSDNEVTIVSPGGERTVPRGPKPAVAAAILDEVERLRASAAAATGLEGEA
jgi:phosphopantothenoylcysteine decarboxylase/phosphopantothenate--cysteine ligase